MKELLEALPEWVLPTAVVMLGLLIIMIVGLIIVAFYQKRKIKLFGLEIDKDPREGAAIQTTEYSELLNKISFLLGIKESLQPFRKEMIKRVLTSTHNEINRIISGANYEVDIGVESNFLLRAKPLFESADKIYAITLNSVSSFWVDKGAKALAREYLRSQPQNTKRLFVFDSSESLRSFWEILSDHYAQYGYNGAVLITSAPNYSKLLSSVLSNEELYLQYQKKDFGLLHYRDHWLLAELDSNRLTFEPVPELASFRLDAEKMISLFDKFSNDDNCKVIDGISIVQWAPSISKCDVESFLFEVKNA